VTEEGRTDTTEAKRRLLSLARSAFGAESPDVVGVAVSGGGDSMALLHLMAQVQSERGGLVRAVTVDHGLRPESAEEARFVGRFCAGLGIAHDTLRWVHGALTGNLSDQARRARYRLIGDWARTKGIGHVVIGHTADDRAETFLMELARQAGLDGLTAMRGAWFTDGIQWSRPFLTVSRAALRQNLRAEGIGWIDDPTNEDEGYQRVRARKALAALAPLGISAEGLANVSALLSLARHDLVSFAHQAAQELATASAGEVILDLGKWQRIGNDTARRLLIAALRWVSSADYAPRAAQVARLEGAISQGRDATLWGCRVRVTPTEIRIAREPKAVQGLACATDALWDARWRLTGPHEAGLCVRALGMEGLRACKNWRETGHSRAALLVSPAIWHGETLISAPLAGFEAGWVAEIVAGFPSSVLSH
jgi:tRNA(Ile)-lysidine synthase